MKNHEVYSKSKGYKNKLLAQKIGIAMATSYFKDMKNTEYQGFMFSWNDAEEYFRNRSKEILFYFSKNPKNKEELEEISLKASLIEFENLKSNFDGELPVKVFKEEEIKENIVKLCTENLLSSEQVDFYQEKKKTVDDIDSEWKSLFLKEYSKGVLIKKSIDKANDVFEKKKVSLFLRKDILFEIKKYWRNVDKIEDLLY